MTEISVIKQFEQRRTAMQDICKATPFDSSKNQNKNNVKIFIW